MWFWFYERNCINVRYCEAFEYCSRFFPPLNFCLQVRFGTWALKIKSRLILCWNNGEFNVFKQNMQHSKTRIFKFWRDEILFQESNENLAGFCCNISWSVTPTPSFFYILLKNHVNWSPLVFWISLFHLNGRYASTHLVNERTSWLNRQKMGEKINDM